MQATEPTAFTLDQQLCHALNVASRAMTGCYRPLLDEIGLTYSQYAVMLVLWEHDGAWLGLSCEKLRLDSATLSPLLQRLESRGLVVRLRRAQDARTVQVELTDAGRGLREHAAVAQARVVGATGLDFPEFAAMREKLQVLTDRLWATALVPEADTVDGTRNSQHTISRR